MQMRDKLGEDEARRIAQYESVKDDVRGQVHREIARDANSDIERGEADSLAHDMKRKAVREVAASEAELERGSAFARASQITDYVFYLIYGVIGLEIALDAVGANPSAGFKRFVDALAAPVLAPFRGLMPTPGVGRFRFMLSFVVALIVYMLLHMAVNGLYRLFVQRKTVV